MRLIPFCKSKTISNLLKKVYYPSIISTSEKSIRPHSYHRPALFLSHDALCITSRPLHSPKQYEPRCTSPLHRASVPHKAHRSRPKSSQACTLSPHSSSLFFIRTSLVILNSVSMPHRCIYFRTSSARTRHPMAVNHYPFLLFHLMYSTTSSIPLSLLIV